MPLKDHVAQLGDKYDIHLLIYAKPLAIIDGIADQFNISRASAVEALAHAYKAGELDPKAHIKRGPGRRVSRVAKKEKS
jgi:hypothetical protein